MCKTAHSTADLYIEPGPERRIGIVFEDGRRTLPCTSKDDLSRTLLRARIDGHILSPAKVERVLGQLRQIHEVSV